MEYVIPILIIGFLIGGLILSYKEKREKKKYEKQRLILRENVIQTIQNLHYSLISLICYRYPKIQFNFLPLAEIIRNFDTIQSPVEKGLTDTIIETYEHFFLKIRLDYTTASFYFNTSKEIDKSIVSNTFWVKEERNRTSRNGKNPVDWKIRRVLVLSRDNGVCQRCGKVENIGTCHIHHIRRRSEGGDHSFKNLVTLCKDCHTLMEGHTKMRTYRTYFISNTKKIHGWQCKYSRASRKIVASYPELRNKGYSPCNHCRPWEIHEKAKISWTYEIEYFVKATLKELVFKSVAVN